MPNATLVFSGKDNIIQAMPLVKGLVNLIPASGAKSNISIVDCVLDGEITITWDDDTTSDVAFTEGMQKAVSNAKTVAVKSGTFHFA